MVDIGRVISALLSRNQAPLNRSIFEAICLSAGADGALAPAELEMVQILAERAEGQTPTKAELDGKVKERIRRLGALPNDRARVEAVATGLRAQPVETRELALSLAALVQYVDGELSESEEALLDSFAQSLDLTLPQAQAVIDRVEGEILNASNPQTGARA